MNQTTHHSLALPRPDDFYDIEVFNKNMQIIDGLLHKMAKAAPKQLAVTILASGTFVPAEYGLQGETVDVYIVGGGGGGARGSGTGNGGGAGGGGFCRMLRNVQLTEASYPIVIGAGGAASNTGNPGGATSAFGDILAGGNNGSSSDGGAGGSGGGAASLGTGFGGTGGTAGSGGNVGGSGSAVTTPGVGGGNIEYNPVNTYDCIAYGSGGGGGTRGRGGGAGGTNSSVVSEREGSLGGGGGGIRTNQEGQFGGTGGLGGGGGGGGFGGSGQSSGGGAGGSGLVYIYAPPRTTPVPFKQPQARPVTFTGCLTPAEIMDCGKSLEAYAVEIGILKAGICINVAKFADLETAKDFLASSVWPGADAVAELSEGYGIGDTYDGHVWIKKEQPEEAGHLEDAQ